MPFQDLYSNAGEWGGVREVLVVHLFWIQNFMKFIKNILVCFPIGLKHGFTLEHSNTNLFFSPQNRKINKSIHPCIIMATITIGFQMNHERMEELRQLQKLRKQISISIDLFAKQILYEALDEAKKSASKVAKSL